MTEETTSSSYESAKEEVEKHYEESVRALKAKVDKAKAEALRKLAG